MNFQRLLPAIALGLVGYLLLLRWFEPVEAEQETSQPAAAQIEQSVSDRPAATDPLPVLETNVTNGDDAGIAFSPRSAPAAQEPSAPPITLRSDLLEIDVDPDSGSVTGARLLKHTETAESGTPYPLMYSDKNGHFTARSGFRSAAQTFSLAGAVPTLIQHDDGATLTLTARTDIGLFTKTIELHPGRYDASVTDSVRYLRDEPTDMAGYAALYRDDRPAPQQREAGLFFVGSYLGGAYGSDTDTYEKVAFDDMTESPVAVSSLGGWVAVVQHYFVTAIVPDQDVAHSLRLSRSGSRHVMGVIDEPTLLHRGDELVQRHGLYMGPKEQDTLGALSNGLDLTVDYGVLWVIGYPLYLLLRFLHSFVDNWGIAIVLMTCCVKILFLHLSTIAYRATARMRQLAPQLERLKERGGTQQETAQATMELYRREKVNPFAGCLPLIVPMPVFIALYWVLLESFELRHAPFILWITDLSAADPYFILPIVLGASMFAMQQMTPQPPTMDAMQKNIFKFMPVLMTLLFLLFPAGLVLYWLTNNIFSGTHQWLVVRKTLQQSKPKAT